MEGLPGDSDVIRGRSQAAEEDGRADIARHLLGIDRARAGFVEQRDDVRRDAEPVVGNGHCAAEKTRQRESGSRLRQQCGDEAAQGEFDY
ncbi:hypothetical protein [Actinospica robiniae]|uniref:hypothetical protein n=1 Tax=Actinospica robiniae TaxID=304901 RepID=UPI0012FBFCF3|nr:hypothetical protein [Actinospica robiniae]